MHGSGYSLTKLGKVGRKLFFAKGYVVFDFPFVRSYVLSLFCYVNENGPVILPYIFKTIWWMKIIIDIL